MNSYEIEIVVTKDGEDVHMKVPIEIPKKTNQIKISICLLIFAICDFVYAFMDNSCVHQKVDFGVNLYTYLLVNAVFSFILMFFIEEKTGIGSEIRSLIVLFSFAWTIVGTIVFWDKMDIIKCSNSTHYYIFISLIIKIILKSFDIYEIIW